MSTSKACPPIVRFAPPPSVSVPAYYYSLCAAVDCTRKSASSERRCGSAPTQMTSRPDEADKSRESPRAGSLWRVAAWRELSSAEIRSSPPLQTDCASDRTRRLCVKLPPPFSTATRSLPEIHLRRSFPKDHRATHDKDLLQEASAPLGCSRLVYADPLPPRHLPLLPTTEMAPDDRDFASRFVCNFQVQSLRKAHCAIRDALL